MRKAFVTLAWPAIVEDFALKAGFAPIFVARDFEFSSARIFAVVFENTARRCSAGYEEVTIGSNCSHELSERMRISAVAEATGLAGRDVGTLSGARSKSSIFRSAHSVLAVVTVAGSFGCGEDSRISGSDDKSNTSRASQSIFEDCLVRVGDGVNLRRLEGFANARSAQTS